MELRRFDVAVFTTEFGASFEESTADNGNYCDAEEVSVAIAELNATIERLRREVDAAEKAQSLCCACGNELAEMVAEDKTVDVWQPMKPQAIACACRSDCKDHIILWDDRHLQVVNYSDRYADMILPPDVRLCRKVTP